MKEFDYLVKNKNGMHVRPCCALVGFVKQSGCSVTVMKGKRTADASELMQLIDMNVCCGDTVHVIVEGKDEETFCTDVELYFEFNF